jgi:hypothetical protein
MPYTLVPKVGTNCAGHLKDFLLAKMMMPVNPNVLQNSAFLQKIFESVLLAPDPAY